MTRCSVLLSALSAFVLNVVSFGGTADAATLTLIADTIHFVGNHALSRQQLANLFPINPGDTLRQAEIEQSVEAILSRYENLGYPFAEVSLDSVTYSSAKTCGLWFTLSDGPLVAIRDVVSEARVQTSPEVFRRGSNVELDKPYRQVQVDRVRSNLERLQVFSSVEEPKLRMRSEHDGVLTVKVDEANTTLFDAIIGYVPPSGTLAGFVAGSIDVSFLNLFASARKLGLHWQRREAHSQDLSVAYREPWILSLPLSGDVKIEQHEQDTLYTRRAGEIGVNAELAEGFTISGTLGASATSPGSVNSVIQRSAEYDAGVVLRYDSRDDPVNPRNGVEYDSKYTAGTKSIAGTSAAIQRVDVNAEIDRQVFARSVGVVALHGAVVSSSVLDESDLLFVGGVQSIRGYREQQFRASRLAWGTVEFRQLIGGRSYLFLFGDAGYFSRGETVDHPFKQQGFLAGYGLGIQTESPLGLLRVSLALGKDDPFSQAKVHLGIVNRF